MPFQSNATTEFPEYVGTMSGEHKKSTVTALDSIELVDIDDSGVFKYVLIEVSAEDESGNEVRQFLKVFLVRNIKCLMFQVNKLIVRGFGRCEYHADIYDEVEEKIRACGLDAQCLGGGRIAHEPSAKRIKVYGYSMGFGRADHTKTVTILKKKYPNYEIEWSNEGY